MGPLEISCFFVMSLHLSPRLCEYTTRTTQQGFFIFLPVCSFLRGLHTVLHSIPRFFRRRRTPSRPSARCLLGRGNTGPQFPSRTSVKKIDGGALDSVMALLFSSRHAAPSTASNHSRTTPSSTHMGGFRLFYPTFLAV